MAAGVALNFGARTALIVFLPFNDVLPTIWYQLKDR